MKHTKFPLALLLLIAVFSIASYSTAAMAQSDGAVTGHLLRSRDSQPLAEVPVQIKETGAKATTDVRGVYSSGICRPETTR